MTTTLGANESTVRIGQHEVQMFSGGSGPPLLYLHGAGGNGGHRVVGQSDTIDNWGEEGRDGECEEACVPSSDLAKRRTRSSQQSPDWDGGELFKVPSLDA